MRSAELTSNRRCQILFIITLPALYSKGSFSCPGIKGQVLEMHRHTASRRLPPCSAQTWPAFVSLCCELGFVAMVKALTHLVFPLISCCTTNYWCFAPHCSSVRQQGTLPPPVTHMKNGFSYVLSFPGHSANRVFKATLVIPLLTKISPASSI